MIPVAGFILISHATINLLIVSLTLSMRQTRDIVPEVHPSLWIFYVWRISENTTCLSSFDTNFVQTYFVNYHWRKNIFLIEWAKIFFPFDYVRHENAKYIVKYYIHFLYLCVLATLTIDILKRHLFSDAQQTVVILRGSK